MPFRESGRMEERVRMFAAYDSGAFSVVDLTARFGVSRQTFYDLKRRRDAGDERWFEDRSRAPKSAPHRTCDGVRADVIAMRKRFPAFGPKKVKARLELEQPTKTWPSASTIGDILKDANLVEARSRRRRPIEQREVIAGSDTPNGEWSLDFKGWFRTADNKRCDPLTIVDTYSRYLIDTRIVEPTYAGVWFALERVFSDIGVPDAIRCDNGVPFGSNGPGGLSRLSVWWLKLGIEPRYIPPASPQHNGRHERFHRTLKDATSKPPASTRHAQQQRFDRFRAHYNNERPHEALAQDVPSTIWSTPTRSMPTHLMEPWYDADHQVARVRANGELKWKGDTVFISEVLGQELIGLAETENGCWKLRYFDRELGLIDRDSRFHRFAPPRARLRFALETKRE